MAQTSVTVRGLQPLVRELKGPMFRDVNKELRSFATLIAKDLVPVVADAVRQSGAPQAAGVAQTVRAHSDRVPVVVIGKTNPKIGNWRRKGDDSARAKRRRGAVAHGVIYGPAGGKRATPTAENYYRISRNADGGPFGHALGTSGRVFEEACDAYLKVFKSVMRAHGFPGGNWNGGH